jgi:Fe-S oxidoreductase
MYSRTIQPTAEPLESALKRMSDTCINCKLCQKECAFLRRHGKPKEIADAYVPGDAAFRSLPFECSLCGLCQAVCPVNVNPAAMFLAMRRDTMSRGGSPLKSHARIKNYEKRGMSKRYTFYALPQNCDTVFFPGCTLPGTRPKITWKTFTHLASVIPNLGMVLDCCGKPSHDLGDQAFFSTMFAEMKAYLLQNGIKKVLVSCPNCYKSFSEYGVPLQVTTVCKALADYDLPPTEKIKGTVLVHDPCVMRFNTNAHITVRELISRKGLTIGRMPHEGRKTVCCGEGGAARLVDPNLTETWALVRKKEARGLRVITYCAGCANLLQRHMPTSHLLDLLFDPKAAINGKLKISRAPFTYLNRLRLKRRLKKHLPAAISRERDFPR